jgi:hypothetical protein
MKKRNFWLTEKQVAGLEALATESVKVAEHVRRAIDAYLRKEARKR